MYSILYHLVFAIDVSYILLFHIHISAVVLFVNVHVIFPLGLRK